MKKLIFLFALTLSLLGLTQVNAQYLYQPTTVSVNDTLTNADSTIFTLPSNYEISSTFPSGALIAWTIYTKAISGTTTALVAYPEGTNFNQSISGNTALWARDYANKDSLQIHAGTFTQDMTPYITYDRKIRLVVKQTGTAVRVIRVAASIRKNPFVITQ